MRAGSELFQSRASAENYFPHKPYILLHITPLNTKNIAVNIKDKLILTSFYCPKTLRPTTSQLGKLE